MSFKPWVLFFSFSLVSMIGCTTQGSSHEMGPVLNDEDLESITPNTTKQQVIEKYGQPSFRCFTPGNHNICYFHQTKKNDTVSDQRQVEIEFDENGKVTQVKIYEPINTSKPKEQNNTESSSNQQASKKSS